MTQLDIPTAAARLGELIAAAAAGEEVVIADAAGRPVARLVAAAAAGTRQFGTFQGRATVADDFDDPLPPDVLAEFYK